MAYLKSPPAAEGPNSSVLAWAKTVATHATIKQAKKRAREQQWRAKEAAAADRDTHHQAFGAEFDWAHRHEMVVQQKLAALGAKGEALYLQSLGMSYAEIAERLQTTVGAVTMMLFSGKKTLKQDPSMASANDGRLARQFASYGGEVVIVQAEVTARDGSTKTTSLHTSPLLWHEDGFVQADVEVPADWPSPLCAAVLCRASRPEDCLASSVHWIAVENGVAKLDVFLGEPAAELVLRGPMPLPMDRITLLFAH